MTTVIDDFSRCRVSENRPLGYSSSAATDRNDDPYGYGDASPDVSKNNNRDYGYGDAAPDTAKKYGYGSASPTEVSQLGYGEGAPDSSSSDPYGYGDAAPTTANNPYGYESTDRNNPYGYGDTSDAASKYGYGDDNDAANKYGYGDDSNPYGYGDTNTAQPHHLRSQSSDSLSSDPRRRRDRPRRRGSVTKYSLEATQEVQKEQQDSVQPAAVVAPPLVLDEMSIPLKDVDGGSTPVSRHRRGTSADMSEDGNVSVGDMSYEDLPEQQPEAATAEKKKKKKRFGRFRIKRNKSGMSTGSNHSASSNS